MKYNSKNKTMTEDVRRILSLMPKTLNEGINFNEDEIEDDDFDDDELENLNSDTDNNVDSEDVLPTEVQDTEEIKTTKELPQDDSVTLVNTIRKMALNGMSKLADNTLDPNYEVLKKIWQFCDKKPLDNEKKNNLNDDI